MSSLVGESENDITSTDPRALRATLEEQFTSFIYEHDIVANIPEFGFAVESLLDERSNLNDALATIRRTLEEAIPEPAPNDGQLNAERVIAALQEHGLVQARLSTSIFGDQDPRVDGGDGDLQSVQDRHLDMVRFTTGLEGIRQAQAIMKEAQDPTMAPHALAVVTASGSDGNVASSVYKAGMAIQYVDNEQMLFSFARRVFQMDVARRHHNQRLQLGRTRAPTAIGKAFIEESDLTHKKFSSICRDMQAIVAFCGGHRGMAIFVPIGQSVESDSGSTLYPASLIKNLTLHNAIALGKGLDDRLARAMCLLGTEMERVVLRQQEPSQELSSLDNPVKVPSIDEYLAPWADKGCGCHLLNEADKDGQRTRAGTVDDDEE